MREPGRAVRRVVTGRQRVKNAGALLKHSHQWRAGANLMLPHTQTTPSDQHGNSAQRNEHECTRLRNDVRLHRHNDRADGGGKGWRRRQQAAQVLKSAGLCHDRYDRRCRNRAHVGRQVRVVIRDQGDEGRPARNTRTVDEQVADADLCGRGGNEDRRQFRGVGWLTGRFCEDDIRDAREGPAE